MPAVVRRSHFIVSALALLALLVSAAPAVAADPGLIVFQGNRGNSTAIYTMNPGGGGAEALAVGTQPSISRDGKTVVFVKGDAIYAIGSSGANLRKVYDGPQESSQPAVSPNGKRVVFITDPGDSGSDRSKVFAVDIDGSDLRQLTRGQYVIDGEPSFSPDGKRIAFIRSPGEPPRVMTMTATGTDLTELTRDSDPFTGPESPTYSPNGKRVVFFAFATGKATQEIYACDADDGRNRVQLTKGDNHGREPALSPDGDSIVYQRGRNLFTMDSDGSNVKQATFLDDKPGFANIRPGWGG
jgi:Tol biopolymer transport system component